MDAQRRGRKVCVTYLVTFVLLAGFFYYLMRDNSRNNKGINRLREDLDDVTHMLRAQQGRPFCNAKDPQPQKLNGVGESGGGSCNQREMTAYVDAAIKKKIGHIMDDVYNLKKQAAFASCAPQMTAKQPKAGPECKGDKNCAGGGGGVGGLFHCNTAVVTTTPRINFASDDLGASILTTTAEPLRPPNLLRRLSGIVFLTNGPINMLRTPIDPGNCFCYKSAKMKAIIRLAKEIIVEGLALTHIEKELSPGQCVDAAPKEFHVYGVPTTRKPNVLLGQYVYENCPKKRTQTYTVKCSDRFRHLLFDMLSNHGANHTCIYRIEVFGHLPP